MIAQAQETQRAVSKFKGTISFRFSANVHSFLSQELLKRKQKSDEPLEEAVLGKRFHFPPQLLNWIKHLEFEHNVRMFFGRLKKDIKFLYVSTTLLRKNGKQLFLSILKIWEPTNVKDFH